MRAERFYWPTLWILAGAVIAAHMLGAGSLRQGFWGADFYGYLPRAALATACALLATGLLLAIGRSAAIDRALLRIPEPNDVTTPGTRLRALAAVCVFFLAFWFFREGHTLLGDGGPLANDLPLGQRFHAREPLTYLIHHGFYELTHRLFRSQGGDAAEIARATVGLSSALAGALFVPVAWGLARELAGTVKPDPADAAVPTARSIVALCFLVLLAQGYIQLFFGYVENYTFSALVLGIYLLTSLRYLRGANPLALPGTALVLNVSLALSAVLLVPSFLVLLARGLATTERRWRTLRDLVVVSLVAAGITALMDSVEPGYNLASAACQVVAQALTGAGDRGESLAYMFSGVHVRDFLNAQLLIGPGAAFLFVAGVAWLVVARARPTAASVFFLVVGTVSLGAAWVTTDLGLGYPRDWDLFAPSGLAFTAAGLHGLLSAPWRGAALRRWLFLLACVCLFHTVPWVWVNTSFDRSFARFKELPLGLGRTQAVVGAYYLAHGDTLQAIPWFERSLEEYPGNNNAAYGLGMIGMNRGLYRWSAQAFWTALRSRPDKDLYRFALVNAIVRGGGRPEWARPHLDTLLMRNPREPVYWAAYGVVCLGLGERDSAASAFRRARRLAPEDSSFAPLLLRVSQPDGYVRAVRGDWPAIAGP